MSCAQVSPDSLASLKDSMTNYRETIRHSVGNPVSNLHDDMESLLTDVSTALGSYLADVLQPVITALKYWVAFSCELLY